MQALTFKRGVHPPEGKALSAEQPLKVILTKQSNQKLIKGGIYA